jgi:hypothetical protein
VKIKALLSIIFLAPIIYFSSKYLSHPKTLNLNTESFHLKLIEHQKSIPGNFLLGLMKNYQSRKFHSELLALNTRGDILFNRSIYNQSQTIVPVNFKKLTDNIYSYFLISPDAPRCTSMVNFLNKDFKDLFLPSSRFFGPELDCHEVLVSKSNSYFFIISKTEKKDEKIHQIIQEWTQNGDLAFSWDTREHLTPKAPSNLDEYPDPFHLNSLSFGENNELFVSILTMKEVVRIQYPNGKVLDEISREKWKFQNDSFGGFTYVHSVKYLGNNRLLLFDNGDEGRRNSRAVEYELDYKNKIAKLVWEFRAYFPNGFRESGGSVQRLSNGNTIIGWGAPDEKQMSQEKMHDNYIILTEVSPARTIVKELYSMEDLISYRVFFSEN